MESGIIEELTRQLTIDTKQLKIPTGFQIDELMHALIRGDFAYIKNIIMEYGKKAIMSQLLSEKDALVGLFAVGMLGCLLIVTSELINNSQITKIANLVIYLVCASMGCSFVEVGQQMCETVGENIGQFMQILLPTYCVCVNVSVPGMVGIPTFLLYQGVLYAMEIVIRYCFIPLIVTYTLVVVVGGIGYGNAVKQLKRLIEKMIELTSKLSVYMGIGWFTIQEICQVTACRGGNALLLKGISMIPGVGKMSEQVTSMILTTGSVLKNIVGIFGILILLIIAMAPVIKLLVIGGGIKLIGAVVTMFGNEKVGVLFDELGLVLMYYMRFIICEVAILCMSILVVVLCLGV